MGPSQPAEAGGAGRGQKRYEAVHFSIDDTHDDIGPRARCGGAAGSPDVGNHRAVGTCGGSGAAAGEKGQGAGAARGPRAEGTGCGRPGKSTGDRGCHTACGAPQSAWVKLCEKATATQKTKDGKDEKKDLNICLTHHERLDGNSGMVLVSAAVRQVEGQDKQAFMVMVPLGMMLQPGMRATLYPKDMWDKAQKNEKIDESEAEDL